MKKASFLLMLLCCFSVTRGDNGSDQESANFGNGFVFDQINVSCPCDEANGIVVLGGDWMKMNKIPQPPTFVPVALHLA